jgi:hypothetical protein
LRDSDEAAAAKPLVAAVKKAREWLKGVQAELREARMRGVAQTATMIWQHLCPESSVSLSSIELKGSEGYNGRSLELDVTVDDADAPALSVVSQGELFSLALALLPGVPGPVRRRLNHQRVRLADALPLAGGQGLPRWQPTRLNTRYLPALRLAEAVLRGTSPEHRPPGPHALTMDGFLLDMNKLFEDFVAVGLREALKEHGLIGRLQDLHHLDIAGLVRVRPDLVVRTADGRTPLAVVDAKYKVGKADGLLNADLYQALAYATVLALHEAHLVYAAGRQPEHHHEVRGTARGPQGRGVRLYQHSLDLTREPGQLVAALREIAGRLAGATSHP